MLSFGISGTGKGSIFQDGDNLKVSGYPGYLYFATGNTDAERMRITSAGRVCIGTTEANRELNVYGSNSTTNSSTSFWNLTYAGLYLRNESNTTNTLTGIGFGGGSSGTSVSGIANILESTTLGALGFYTGGSGVSNTVPERMRIDSSGNLIVGRTDLSNTVGVDIRANGLIKSVRSGSTNADDTLDVYSTGAGAFRFYVGMGGTIFATSTTISAISDQRLKENVRNLDFGLPQIMALQPRKFDWKEGKGLNKKDDVGFIAQEFETVFPSSVDTSKAGADGIEYKTVNHSELIPTLVKAIQEQQALIENLTTRLNALEGN
jgi:hypothetical protein